MNNNKKVFILLIVTMLLLTTGCQNDKYLKGENNQILTNEETGQSIRKDILCKPEEGTSLYNIYKDNEDSLGYNIDDLVSCEDFTPSSGEYKGLWNQLLTKPMAWLILKLGYLLGNFGLSVIILGLLIRLILLPLSIKNLETSKNMQKANPELQAIQRKYANKTDTASQMAMSNEISYVYKKYKCNPFTGCLMAFIQIPIFFAFLDAIYEVPAIYEDSLFGMNLAMTPLKGLQNHQYYYIILIILIIASTYFTFKNAMANQDKSNKDMMDQMNYMMIFMLISITIASFNLPTAIAFYWVATSIFGIFQQWISNKILDNNDEKKSKKKVESRVIDAKIKEKKGKKQRKK